MHEERKVRKTSDSNIDKIATANNNYHNKVD